jgi:hypothetical protein
MLDAYLPAQKGVEIIIPSSVEVTNVKTTTGVTNILDIVHCFRH